MYTDAICAALSLVFYHSRYGVPHCTRAVSNSTLFNTQGSHVILNMQRLAEAEEDEDEPGTRSRLVFARKDLEEIETVLGNSG